MIRWKRKVGRCPNGYEIEQVMPPDEELAYTKAMVNN